MKKRVIGSLLAMVLVLSSAVGCSSESTTEEASTATTEAAATEEAEETVEASGEMITITFSNFFVEGEVWETGTVSAIEAFNADHEGVVEIIMDAMPHDAYLTQMNAVGVADDVSEMAMVSGTMMASFSEIGSIVPLNDIYEEYGFDTYLKEGVIDECTSTSDGLIYSLPLESAIYGLILYNTEIFAEAGYDEFPETLEELYEASAKIQDTGIIPMMLGDVAFWPADSILMSAFVNNYVGNDWYQSIRENDGTASFTDQEFIDALTAFQGFEPYFNEDYASLGNIDRLATYASGDAAMISAGLWECGSITDLNEETSNVTQAALWPSSETATAVDGSAVSSAAWGVAVGSKATDEQIEYIGEFIRDYWFTEEHGQYLTEEQDTVASWTYEYDETQLSVPAASMMEVAATATSCLNWDSTLQSTIKEIYQRGLQEVLIGTATPEELAADMQEELEALR